MLEPDLSFEDYLSRENHIHSSDLKKIFESMNHYEMPNIDKSGYKIGTFGHVALLEFAEIFKRYLSLPQEYSLIKDKRSVKARDLKQAYLDKATEENKILVTFDEWTEVLKWRENILADPVVGEPFEKNLGQNEVSGFFEHPNFPGINGAFRMDKYLPDLNLIIDLKFMLSANPRSFFYDCRKYRYDIQASWYLDGIKAITGEDYDFIFVVCEKSPPNNVQAFRLNDKSIERARADIRGIINKYQEFQNASPKRQKMLSGYYDGIYTLDLWS